MSVVGKDFERLRRYNVSEAYELGAGLPSAEEKPQEEEEVDPSAEVMARLVSDTGSLEHAPKGDH